MPDIRRRTFLGATGLLAVPVTIPSSPPRVAFVGSYAAGLDVALAGDAGLRRGFTVPGVPAASWFALSADKKVLYATNETEDGTVTAVDVRDPLKPAVLGSRSTLGAGPTHLSVAGRHLLTANYTSGSLVVHPIRRDGTLGEATDLVPHEGAQPHAHQVLPDPSGRWVLAVDLGTNSVYVYRLDAGKLVAHQQVSLPAGTGPRHLAFHPGGRALYVACELDPAVVPGTWDPVRGEVRLGDAVPAGVRDQDYPGEIAVSPDGRFVYVSVRGANTIAALRTGRALTPVQAAPTGGNWPRHFTFDTSARRLYVSNQRSGTVTWLPRDPATGRLGAAEGELSAPEVATVLFR
ncbi:lactonase family protein [Amycolatopsis sp. NPDC006125]|uniref:lactonase family protein n=1 Tax=Amycolatopsis sp. NPDC006125 TaxID=3156730 RepID=UPI0033BEF5EB